MSTTRIPGAVPDPYERCEHGCTHDLGRGVLISELLSKDGPFSHEPPRTMAPWIVEAVRRSQDVHA